MEFRTVERPKYIGSWKKFEAENEVGTVVVEGEYLGTSQGKFGELYDFDADGKKVVLNQAGHLKYLLDNNVEIGDFVRVTYMGKEILEKGVYAGTASHQFELAVAVSEGGNSLDEEKEIQKEVVEETMDFDDEFAGI